MKYLEIIQKIIKIMPNARGNLLLSSNSLSNLTILCALDRKYLTKKNLNLILDDDDRILIEYPPSNRRNSIDKKYYSNLALLISVYPDLIDKMSKEKLLKIKPYDWVIILKSRPELIDKCNVEFKLHIWIEILSVQPQLVSKYKDFYKEVDENKLHELVFNNKEILNYIDVKKINIYNYTDIISVYPIIINELTKDKINSISIKDWLKIFETNPDLIKKCPILDRIVYNNDNKYNIINLVSKQPTFKYLLPSCDKISNDELSFLIKTQPQLIEELKIDLERLNGENWCEILMEQPQLIHKCNKINDIPISSINSHMDWGYILIAQPSLIKYCDKNKLNNYSWDRILINHPDLLDECKIKLLKSTKTDLLTEYPYLINKIDIAELTENEFRLIIYDSREYHIKFMEKYIENYHDSKVLTNMIGIYPDLKELYIKKDLWKYVDFTKLTENIEYSILK